MSMLKIFNIPELVSQLMSADTNGSTMNMNIHHLFKNKTHFFFTSPQSNVTVSNRKVSQPGTTTTASTTGQTEDTIQMSKLAKDHRGHWVYNPWSVTFGNRMLDTRFTKSQPYVHINVVSNPKHFYDPRGKLSTVCMGSTIPHGDFKVVRWGDRHIYRHKQTSQAFYLNLRRDLYIKGKSEVCHDKKYNKWMDYQECALRRNQRLESFIPKYPFPQLIKEKS